MRARQKRYFLFKCVAVRVNLQDYIKNGFLNNLINEYFLGKITPEI